MISEPTVACAGDIAENFLTRVDDRECRIGIIGLGYVGIPLALRFSEVGFSIIGFDIDEVRVATLNSGESPIEHIPAALITAMRQGGFEATSEFSRIAEVDAIVICVPTPLSRHREPDLTFIIETMKTITPMLREGQLLSLESTTWPGTTEEVLRPFIEKQGLIVGKDFFLVYSPEREDPGNPNFTTRQIPKVVGGSTPACSQVGERLYATAVDRVVAVSSTRAAELTKLLENIHRAVNIGLVNEMKIIADRMDIDIFEVIEAAATKPFGFTAYYPGPGLGGHCIPIDPFYLTWKAREYGLHTRFIELAGEINRSMPEYVFGKLVAALNDRDRALRGAKILFLGIAYKKNVDDMRESPAVHLMELVRASGGEVGYSDPHVPTFPKMREHVFDLSSLELTPSILAGADAVIVTTDHDKFDFALVQEHASLIIDTRGVFRAPLAHVVRA